jgi:TIR domain
MRFSGRRGENALRLALHAAVPQVLRADLLHLLRLNFVPESLDDSAVEADVLFAPFCENLGNGYYRFEQNVRRQLLNDLDPTYENDTALRSQQVASFLLAYFGLQSRSIASDNDHLYGSYLEVERWVALAFLDPTSAATQLAAAVRHSCDPDEVTARMQIGGLTSALSTPLAPYQKLLAYAAGVEALQAGQFERAYELLDGLGDREIRVGKIILRSARSLLKDYRRTLAETAKPKPKSVFISYHHSQGDWVWDRLVPCLLAGGADIHLDRERFEIGKAVVGQMDAIQDRAEMAVLVLSSDYLNSPYCVHEMERAIRRDPKFARGIVVPIKRRRCALPANVKPSNPLYVDLQNDSNADKWGLLLQSCEADLGAPAPHWLDVLHETCRFLQQGYSVNLVVRNRPKWRELIREVRSRIAGLAEIDLESGATASRKALVEEILRACGAPGPVPNEPNDLVVLDRALKSRDVCRLAMIHFDMVRFRPSYDVNLFALLRHLIIDSRKLVLLIQSREFFANLLPAGHTLNPFDDVPFIKTVELNGRA